jgi:hypothetical protein
MNPNDFGNFEIQGLRNCRLDFPAAGPPAACADDLNVIALSKAEGREKRGADVSAGGFGNVDGMMGLSFRFNRLSSPSV